MTSRMNQRTMDDENIIDQDLPWYKDVYNYVTSPEFRRKPTKEELWDTTKGSLKQVGSFYNDLVGLGYNALDPGGIIPGVGTDDPNFGLLDFFGNMIRQKRQGEFNVPLSEVLGNPEFLEYTNNLNSSVIREKEHDMQKRFDEIIAQTGVDVESIPEDIRRNAFRDENGATNFLQEIRFLGGVNLDDNSSMELDSLMNKFIMKENDYDQFYRDNSIMKVDWSNEENPMVTFGDMPKVDEGFFGLDMILDPGYTPGGDLSLTNLGKYRMVDGELTRVQPSVQNWASDWNVNPDRMSGILQSTPGYEALGNMIDDKWVKNVAWKGHEFDFPEGVESQDEKEAFLLTMYPLMAAGAVAPVSKLATSRPGRMTTGIGGTTVAASLPNIYEEPE
jgi:hypothetical protein